MLTIEVELKTKKKKCAQGKYTLRREHNYSAFYKSLHLEFPSMETYCPCGLAFLRPLLTQAHEVHRRCLGAQF